MSRKEVLIVLILLVFFISACEEIQFSKKVDVPETFTSDEKDEINLKGGYIVEFKTPPVLKRKLELEKQGILNKQIDEEIQIYKQTILSEHIDFKDSVKSILGKKINVIYRKEFTDVLNGISMNINFEDIEKIEALPNVKRVVKNEQVNAMLIYSVPSINANDVWDLGYSGEGVKIAIIDTGVDYTHPDLGGCFGQGCKVIGGYDFVNNDSDPMDDHGHGTHCAGIASSSDGNNVGLIGVAPDSKIYAYKVLDERGMGDWDVVIAGIEQSVLDNVDVISLSLGGGGNPDDPVSEAIDNAVNSGVIAVVAAGNSGPMEKTINSPGTARNAITVGATDKYENNYVASFSSRGPVDWIDENGIERLLMKPDLVAPGISICSSQYNSAWSDSECIDNYHTSISGTSMATPHVAGAVALLKQAKPDWSADEIRMALRNTAVDIVGRDFSSQGYGRLDILGAINFQGIPTIAKIESGGKIEGVSIDINGTANGREFRSYEVYYGIGSTPSSWNLICSKNISVTNGILCSNFNVSLFNDGTYTLKLLVSNAQGEKSEDISFVVKKDLDLQKIGDSLGYLKDIENVEGIIYTQGYESYNLEYNNGNGSGEWNTICNGTEITGRWICSIDVSQFENGVYYFRLSVKKDGNIITGNELRTIVFHELLDGWPVEIFGFPGGKVNLADNNGIKKLIIPHFEECYHDSNTDNNKIDLNSNFLQQKAPSYFYAYLGVNDKNYSANDMCTGTSLYVYYSDSSYNHIMKIGEKRLSNDGAPTVYKNTIAINEYLPRSFFSPDAQPYYGLIDFDGVNHAKEWEGDITYGESLVVNQDNFFNVGLEYDYYNFSFTGNILIKGFNNKGELLSNFPLIISQETGNYSFALNQPRIFEDGGLKVLAIHGSYDIDEEGRQKNLNLYLDIYSLNGTLIKRTNIISNFSHQFQVYMDYPVIGDINNDGKVEIIIGVGLFDLELYDENRFDVEAYKTYFYVFDSSGELLSTTNPIKGYILESTSMSIGNFGTGKPSVVAGLGTTWSTDYYGNGYKIISFDYLGNIELEINTTDNQIIQPSIVIGDVDEDNESEIVANYRPKFYYPGVTGGLSGIKIFNFEGIQEREIKIPTTGDADDYYGNPPILTDFDNDGVLDIVQQSLYLFEGHTYTRIYAYTLGYTINKNKLDWPMYLHDPQHTGNYDYNKCGDSIIQTPNLKGFNEECDDGNKINTDSCTNECKLARANDGICWQGHEQCGVCYIPENDSEIPCDDCLGYQGEVTNCNENQICMNYNPTTGEPGYTCALTCSYTQNAGCFWRECPRTYTRIPSSDANIIYGSCDSLGGQNEWLCCALPGEENITPSKPNKLYPEEHPSMQESQKVNIFKRIYNLIFASHYEE